MEITIAENLGPSDCPYVKRWVFECRWFSIRLHHWLYSDDLRHEHDHAWSFLSMVLVGKIIEVVDGNETVRKAGTVHYFPATYKHAVRVANDGAWTLLLTGPISRPDWGMWVDGKQWRRNKYFNKFGRWHPCENRMYKGKL